MELLEKGMKKSVAGVTCPEDLTKDRVIAVFKEANEFSITKFKSMSNLVKNLDPMLAPIVNSCLSHDYITKTHNIPETVFKVALSKFEIYNDKELGEYMNSK